MSVSHIKMVKGLKHGSYNISSGSIHNSSKQLKSSQFGMWLLPVQVSAELENNKIWKYNHLLSHFLICYKIAEKQLKPLSSPPCLLQGMP